MAERKEVLILEVDASSLAENLGEARVELVKYEEAAQKAKEETGEMSAEFALASAQSKAFAAQVKQQENALVKLLKAKQDLGGDLKTLIKTYDAEANTVERNRKVLNALNGEYDRSDKAGRERLIPTIQKINKALSEQEAATGRNFRSVGGYKQAILDAVGELNIFGKSVSSVIDPLKKFKDGFAEGGGGVAGFSSGLKGLVTGALPLFAGGIGTAVSALLSFGPVAEFTEKATAAMAVGFKAFVNGGDAIEAAKHVFELKERLKELNEEEGRARLGTARVSAEIEELILQSQDRSIPIFERIKKLREANRLAETDAEGDKKRQEKRIKDEEALFKEEKRLTQIELETLLEEDDKITLKFGKNSEEIAKIRFIANSKITKDDAEAIKKLQDNRIKLVEIDRNLNQILLENKNKISKFNESIAESDEKAEKQKEEDAKKERERLDKAAKERQAYLDKISQLETEFQLTEREKIEKGFNDKLALIKGQTPREVALRLDIETAKQQALDKFDEDAETRRQQKIADRMIKDAEDKRRALEEIKLNHDLQLELERQFNRTQQQIDDEFDAWVKANPEKKFLDFYNLKMATYKKDVESKQAADTLWIQSEQAKNTAFGSISNSIIGLIGNVADAAGAGAEFQKELAFIQLLIQQAVAIANAVVGATASATATGPGAIVTTPMFIATLVGAVTSIIGGAVGLLSDANIPKPGFATGVIGLQGAGSETSDSIPVNLSKNESVITAKATKAFAPQLALMEMLVGNKPNFTLGSGHYAGGIINFRSGAGLPRIATNMIDPTGGQDGGFVARGLIERADELASIKSISEALKLMPAPIVSVSEFNRVNKGKAQSVKVSEL